MNESKLVDVLAKKENKALTSLLFIGLIGSTCVHVAAMITPVPSLWKTANTEPEDTIEIVVEVPQPDASKVPEIAKELEPILPAHEEVPPIEAAPEAIALAPEAITPVKEGKDAAAPDNLKPLTTQNPSDVKVPQGGGSIIANSGTGSGFGNAKIPTGFVLGGKINGNPNGKQDGVIGGSATGKPDSQGTQTSALPPAPFVEPKAVKLECLSCPKPQYRGKEGTPRVTYDIAPDGRVVNVRLRQSSGDAQTDRETLEAMSQWQFNPQTVPEGGRTNVRVRVTFEEEGSNFQRQNEERRRESERLAEQERQQREAMRSQPAPAAIAPVNTPSINSSTPERSPTITTTSPVVDAPSVAPQPEPIVDEPPAASVVIPAPAIVVDSPQPTESTTAPPPLPLPTSSN